MVLRRPSSRVLTVVRTNDSGTCGGTTTIVDCATNTFGSRRATTAVTAAITANGTSSTHMRRRRTRRRSSAEYCLPGNIVGTPVDTKERQPHVEGCLDTLTALQSRLSTRQDDAGSEVVARVHVVH